MLTSLARAPFTIRFSDLGHVSIWNYLDLEPNGSDTHTWDDVTTHREVEEIVQRIAEAIDAAGLQSKLLEVTVLSRDGFMIHEGLPVNLPEWPWHDTVSPPAVGTCGADIVRSTCGDCGEDRLVADYHGKRLCKACVTQVIGDYLHDLGFTSGAHLSDRMLGAGVLLALWNDLDVCRGDFKPQDLTRHPVADVDSPLLTRPVPGPETEAVLGEGARQPQPVIPAVPPGHDGTGHTDGGLDTQSVTNT